MRAGDHEPGHQEQGHQGVRQRTRAWLPVDVGQEVEQVGRRDDEAHQVVEDDYSGVDERGDHRAHWHAHQRHAERGERGESPGGAPVPGLRREEELAVGGPRYRRHDAERGAGSGHRAAASLGSAGPASRIAPLMSVDEVR